MLMNMIDLDLQHSRGHGLERWQMTVATHAPRLFVG
jgi:hypothetical protein